MNMFITSLCEHENINGGVSWSRQDGSIYNPIGSSTMDFLNVIGDMYKDISRNSIVDNSIKLVMDYYDSKTRQFRYSTKSQKIPCITAKIISILKKLKIEAPFYNECYQMFFETQQEDGGWRCATVNLGKSPKTDASNPGTTLYVLDALRYRENSLGEMKAINKAIEFLLNHWITRKPLGPCEFGIGTTFMKTEYPFYRYNIFYYVYALSFYDKARKDKRFVEVVSSLKSKETNTGIKVENPHKYWKDILFYNANECNLSNLKYKELLENLSKS